MIYRLSSVIFLFSFLIQFTPSSGADLSADAIKKEADEIYYSSGKYYDQPDSLLFYAEELKKISGEIDYKLGYIHASFLSGMGYHNKKLFDKAARELYHGLSIIQENPSPELLIKEMIILQLLAATYDETYHYSNAIEINKNALKIADELQDTVSLGELYFNIGNAYYHSTNYVEAKSYLEKSLVYRKLTSNHTKLSKVYNSIGLIYQKKEDYTKAIQYFESALNEVPGNSKEKIWYISNIGLCYEKTSDYHNAIVYYNKALRATEEIQDNEKERWILNNLGDIHLVIKDYAKAISFFQESLRLVHTTGGFDEEYARATEQIAKAYHETGDYKQASLYKDQFIAQANILEKTNESLNEQISQFRMKEIEWELEKQKQQHQISQLSSSNLWFKVSLFLLAIILALASYHAHRYYAGMRAVKRWIASE